MKKTLIAIISAVFLIGCLPFIFGYSAYQIPSRHMLPTMNVGDYLFVDHKAYKNESPKLGELITYLNPKQEEVVMVGRVIGTADSVLEFKDGVRFISGEKVFEEYIDISMAQSDRSKNFGPFHIPKGTIVVLGDNRDNSYDSRYFGYVPLNKVTGKIVKVL